MADEPEEQQDTTAPINTAAPMDFLVSLRGRQPKEIEADIALAKRTREADDARAAEEAEKPAAKPAPKPARK
jgi:hypothetical protein